MIEQKELPTNEVRGLIAACFSDRTERGEREVRFATTEPDFDPGWQAVSAEEALRDLELQARAAPFDGWVKSVAREVAKAGKLEPLSLGRATRFDLLTGAARLLAEEQRRFLHRLNDRLLPYEPQDALFTATQSSASCSAIPSTLEVGPTIEEVVDAYLKAKATGWATKTTSSRSRQLGYMAEFLGSHQRVSQLNAQHFAALGDAISRLRLRHHTGEAKSFASRQTDDPKGRIAAKTARLIFEACKACFAWAKRRGLIGADPAAGMELDLAKEKGPKGEKPRRPFSANELTTLFSSPLFRGHASAARRLEAGTVVTRDAKFWVPLIGFYSGMRLGEIIQLTHADIRLDQSIACFAITEVDATGCSDLKHVKTHASVRDVPVHPHLLALGFREFCSERAADADGKGRLFAEVSYGADGMPSTIFSKWFGRILTKMGLADPALVFHSFRHGMEDALRNAKEPQYVIDRILGHTTEGMGGVYGQGVSLAVAMEAMKAAVFPVSPFALLTTQGKS